MMQRMAIFWRMADVQMSNAGERPELAELGLLVAPMRLTPAVYAIGIERPIPLPRFCWPA
jgi:hypothetical protein